MCKYIMRNEVEHGPKDPLIGTTSLESVPFSPSEVYKTLKKYPYKRLRFVTIKDNKQEFVKLGKVLDYLRRFSEKIWLVSSPVGGIHFHALIVLKEGRKTSFKKGIHTRFDTIGEKNSSWDPEMLQQKEEYARELAEEETLKTGSEASGEAVYNAVMAPPSKELQAARRKVAKDKKQSHIERVVSYLNKNANENSCELVQYTHWCTFPRVP